MSVRKLFVSELRFDRLLEKDLMNMCGITGFWNFRTRQSLDIASEILSNMVRSLSHRGPDSHGVWHSEEQQLSLGHARLAILDLSPLGHQPMTSQSGRFVIVYNGEIYNAFEIKKDLEKAGYRFKGGSDTEIILEAIDHWGLEKALEKFIGMFAFSLYDQKLKKLFLVRDRMGVKPLYWGIQNSVLIFGSELKVFHHHPSFNLHIDQNAAAEYFQFMYVPAPRSIFQNVWQLKPAHFVEISASGDYDIKCYWNIQEKCLSLHETQFQEHQRDEAVNSLEDLLKDAVKMRMISDVPLGAFLSGGIDSSLVVSLMQTQSSQKVKTFSIGFQEGQYNEAVYAKQVAQHLGTDHEELYLSEKHALDLIPSLSKFYDEPFSDSSQIPTYFVSQLARQKVTVSLSGDGGDELFAGYNRYHQGYNAWQKINGLPNFLKLALKNTAQNMPNSFYSALHSMLPATWKLHNIERKVLKFKNILNSPNAGCYYYQLISETAHLKNLFSKGYPINLPPICQNIFDKSTQLEVIEQMSLCDMMYYLPYDILTKVDRASMAVSLESREPLLDHRLVEFSFKTPLSFKIHQNKSKWILRQILYKYVPSELIERPKTGFGIPLGKWLKGELKDWAHDHISTLAKSQDNFFNHAEITSLWDKFLKGYPVSESVIWSLVMFEDWKRRYNARF